MDRESELTIPGYALTKVCLFVLLGSVVLLFGVFSHHLSLFVYGTVMTVVGTVGLMISRCITVPLRCVLCATLFVILMAVIGVIFYW